MFSPSTFSLSLTAGVITVFLRMLQLQCFDNALTVSLVQYVRDLRRFAT